MKKLPLLLLSCALLGASCAGTARRESGVYRSEDFGMTWEAINQVDPNFNQTLLARSGITELIVSPTTESTLFASTTSQGLFKSQDHGDLWSPITTPGGIQSFSIHPLNESLIIAARDHQLFLTENGGELWQLVYTNPTNSFITDVQFDSFDEATIYASIQTGELLRTSDGARSWSILTTFDDPISDLLLTPRASQRFYVVIPDDGIYRSDDKGLTWTLASDTIQRPLDQFTNPLRFQQLIIHRSNPSDLLLQTSLGLFHSSNAGEQWNEIALLTENDKRQMRSIAWDPLNRSAIYYVTNSVFYRSDNFGRSWTTIPFASGSPPSLIIPDPFVSGRLYLGTRQ